MTLIVVVLVSVPVALVILWVMHGLTSRTVRHRYPVTRQPVGDNLFYTLQEEQRFRDAEPLRKQMRKQR